MNIKNYLMGNKVKMYDISYVYIVDLVECPTFV